MNKAIQTLAGLLTGFICPLITGAAVASLQTVHFRTFIWSIMHRIPFYNSFYQLGIAINIGVFFLFMKKENAIFFGRGWLVATVLSVLWTLLIEINRL